MREGDVVGTVVDLTTRTRAGHGAAAEIVEQQRDPSTPVSDILRRCSDLIGSTIYDRVRELGGTERDVRQLASSAAYAVFIASAAELFGD